MGVPALAAARLQRWALLLAAYQYDIRYKSSAEHANADGLSQLPVCETGQKCNTEFKVSLIEAIPMRKLKKTSKLKLRKTKF